MTSTRRRSGASSPSPTEAELDVLRVLWRRGPSTVREVHGEIARSRNVGYTTVLKQMQIMHGKGLLKRSERFRSHVYEAREARSATQDRLARSLLSRAFGGSVRELIQSALSGHKIHASELAEIRRLLDEIERGGR